MMSAPSPTSSVDLADGLVAVGRIHLVALAMAEVGGGAGGLAERAVEAGGVLGRVGHDRQVLEALLVERLAHPADEAVHHARRRDDVGAGARLRRARRGRGSRASRRCRRRRRRPRRSGRGVVYSSKQASSMTVSSGHAFLMARVACCTRPSSFHASEPTASFLSGTPKRMTAGMPSSCALLRLGDRFVDGELRLRRAATRSACAAPLPGMTKSG